MENSSILPTVRCRQEEPVSPDRLYALDEVAEFLLVDKDTVQNWIETGNVKVIGKKVDGRGVFTPDDLELFKRHVVEVEPNEFPDFYKGLSRKTIQDMEGIILDRAHFS